VRAIGIVAAEQLVEPVLGILEISARNLVPESSQSWPADEDQE
jgi:hypothetical protein